MHGSVYKSDAMTAGILHTLVLSPILCNVGQVCASLLIPLHRDLSDTDDTITEKLLLQLESLQKNFTTFKLFLPVLTSCILIPVLFRFTTRIRLQRVERTSRAEQLSNVSTISQKQHQSTSSGDTAFVCAVACRGLNLEATVVAVLLPFSFWTVCPRGMRLAVISCISSFKTLKFVTWHHIFFILIDVLFFALLLLWSPLVFCVCFF